MAAADKPILYYFDSPGAVEISRLLLVYLEKEFEDFRFTRDEWVSSYKAQAPLGMAPFYEEGDFKLGGSQAIARYIAEQNGMGGRNPMENAQLGSYVDAIFDIGSKLYGVLMGPEEKREECKQEFLMEMPRKLGFLEKQVKSEKHFLDGDKISWADFAVSNIFGYFHFGNLDVVAKDCPKLTAIASNIDAMEKIKEWRVKTHKAPK